MNNKCTYFKTKYLCTCTNSQYLISSFTFYQFEYYLLTPWSCKAAAARRQLCRLVPRNECKSNPLNIMVQPGCRSVQYTDWAVSHSTNVVFKMTFITTDPETNTDNNCSLFSVPQLNLSFLNAAEELMPHSSAVCPRERDPLHCCRHNTGQ